MRSKELALRDRLDEIGIDLDKAAATLQLLLESLEPDTKIAVRDGFPGATRVQAVYLPALGGVFDLVHAAAAKANDQEVGV